MKSFPTVPGLSTPRGYSYVVSATGRMVFVSGQIALDAEGAVVGAGDLRAQANRVYENLAACLAAAGAGFGDVVKINTYVVNLKADDLPVIREVRSAYFPGDGPPASTLVGVTALAADGLLIEVEAVAMLD
jgi:enamine deaminase RidA (YjgF/YER057c/UK114 family)